MIYSQTYSDDYVGCWVNNIVLNQAPLPPSICSVLDPLLIALLPFTASMWLLVLLCMIGESLAVGLIERAHNIINVCKQNEIGPPLPLSPSGWPMFL